MSKNYGSKKMDKVYVDGGVSHLNHDTGEVTMAEEEKQVREIAEIVECIQKDLQYQIELRMLVSRHLAPVSPEEVSSKDDYTRPSRVTPLGEELQRINEAVCDTNRFLNDIVRDVEL